LYTCFPLDVSFLRLLVELDALFARELRAKRCQHCGGPHHQADYLRKPRGFPDGEDPGWDLRTSFCCGHCRRRATPFSVRFLGRKVYLGLVVVLAAALRHGPQPRTVEKLVEIFGASVQTIWRWRDWWLESFRSSAFFRAGRGERWVHMDGHLLPHSLLKGFGGRTPESLLALLRFLAPLTSRSSPGSQAF
jgi:hypothetical protein